MHTFRVLVAHSSVLNNQNIHKTVIIKFAAVPSGAAAFYGLTIADYKKKKNLHIKTEKSTSEVLKLLDFFATFVGVQGEIA